VFLTTWCTIHFHCK